MAFLHLHNDSSSCCSDSGILCDVVCRAKSFSDDLHAVYRAATVDDERVCCIVTQLSDADAASCLDYINCIVVSAAVNYSRSILVK